MLLLLVFPFLLVPFLPPSFCGGLVLLVMELMALCYPLSLSLPFFSLQCLLAVILSSLVFLLSSCDFWRTCFCRSAQFTLVFASNIIIGGLYVLCLLFCVTRHSLLRSRSIHLCLVVVGNSLLVWALALFPSLYRHVCSAFIPRSSDVLIQIPSRYSDCSFF